MNDRRSEIADLDKVALEHASAGRLAEAEVAHRDLIALATECDHWSLSEYHTRFAIVLARLGRDEDAQDHYEEALAIARGDDPDEGSSSVAIARYFFAEFLVGRSRADEALLVLSPSLAVPCSLEGILRLIEAESAWALGNRDDAQRAAGRALDLAKSDDQRERIQLRLSNLGGWPDAG